MTRTEILAIAKPILFNTEMTRAIMDGRKTQTRRIIKPQYAETSSGEHISLDVFQYDVPLEYFAPYEKGDILYVRETWCRVGKDVDKIFFENSEVMWNGMYLYKADGYDLSGIGSWHPSIHMPKEAARTFLQVTGVKAQRLQDITEEQAIDEGAKDPYEYQKEEWYEQRGLTNNYSVDAFAGLWDRTVKKSDLPLYGWEANPWVWVYDFKTVEIDT